MSLTKRISVSLALCLILVSSTAEAKNFGPAVVGIFAGLALTTMVTTAVLSVPPNVLFPNSYAPTKWIASGYVAVLEDCFEGCWNGGTSMSSDTPQFCFYAKYTAHVKGVYAALLNNVTVQEPLQRHRVCGDSEQEALSNAQAAYPSGTMEDLWYRKGHPEQSTDGSPSGVMVGMAVGSGLLGIVGIIGAICWGAKLRTMSPPVYVALNQAIAQ